MSSYVLKILAPDERILYAASVHWIVYLQGIMFTVMGGVLGFYAPNILTALLGQNMAHMLTKPAALAALVIVAMGFSLLLGAYIRQVSTELVVTNRRVIAKYGYISRETFELMISRVTGANFDQTILGRILGYGTIIVRGAGGDISPIDFIADPQAFHNVVMSSFEGTRGA
jgi:uncharacterized membrane protein YdbT with pleckstrin-like domain